MKKKLSDLVSNTITSEGSTDNAPKKKVARGTDEWAEMYRKKNAQSQQKLCYRGKYKPH